MADTVDTKRSSKPHERSDVVAGTVFLLVLAFFWPTLVTFPEMWRTYDVDHWWLVVGLVSWLAWRHRGELLESEGGNPVLLISVVALSLLWFAGIAAGVKVVHQHTLLPLLVAWGIAVFGGSSAATVGVMGVTSLLAFPYWRFLKPILQEATTLVSGGMVNLLGIPAEIQGNYIHISVGTFQIGGGCAGLSTLMAGLVIAAFYAHILVKRRRTQLKVVCLAVAISIVGNWIRVITIVVIGHLSSMQSSVLPDHIWLGWMIFTIGLFPFFIIARWIDNRDSRKSADAGVSLPFEKGKPVCEAESCVGDRDNGQEQRNWHSQSVQKRVMIAGSLAIMGPALYFFIGAVPTVETEALDISVISHGGGWKLELTDTRPFDWHPAYQGATRHEKARFTNGGRNVYADQFIYRQQEQGAELVGYLNSIAPKADILRQRLIGPVDAEGKRWVQQAIIRAHGGPVLTWYWYRVGGVDTAMPVYAKILEIPAFIRRRRGSELVALSAACEPEDCTNAFEVLAEFMGMRTPGLVQPAQDPDTSG